MDKLFFESISLIGFAIIQLPELMVYLHQVTKEWLPSSNVAVTEEVREWRNANFTQNIQRIDDDNLRDVMQIIDNRIVKITTELKALAEKVDNIDTKIR